MDTLIMNNGLIYTQLVMMEEEVVKEALVVALPKLFMRPREGHPAMVTGMRKQMEFSVDSIWAYQ